MANHTLLCPFLHGDPAYALGVEFGMLYARMQSSDEPITDYFLRENQDQILLLASRLGRSVAEIKPWDKHWFWCRISGC